jgi:D-xylose transport system substrate-binding protein
MLLTACGGSTSSGGGAAAGPKIALLLPETKTARYESKDRPLFEAKAKALCNATPTRTRRRSRTRLTRP